MGRPFIRSRFAMEIYKSSNFYKSCCNYYQPTSNNPNSAIGPIDRLILLLHRYTSPLLLFKLSSFSYAPWTSLSVRTSWPRDNHVSCFRSADRTKKTTRRQMSPSRSKRNRMPSAIVSAYLLTGGTVRIRLAEPISESRLLRSRRKCKCRLLRVFNSDRTASTLFIFQRIRQCIPFEWVQYRAIARLKSYKSNHSYASL